MSTPIPNLNISSYAPGAHVTAQASATVTAKRFVAISGGRVGGAGNISIAPATAAGRTCGVAAQDGAVGALVLVVRGNSRVVRVTAEGSILAGAEVEVGVAGKAKTLGAGRAVGYAIADAADGADCEVSLY